MHRLWCILFEELAIDIVELVKMDFISQSVVMAKNQYVSLRSRLFDPSLYVPSRTAVFSHLHTLLQSLRRMVDGFQGPSAALDAARDMRDKVQRCVLEFESQTPPALLVDPGVSNLPAVVQVQMNPIGRPALAIRREELLHLEEADYKVKDMAAHYCVSVFTISRRLAEEGIRLRPHETDNALVKDTIGDIRSQATSSMGIRSYLGALQSRGVVSSRALVADILREVDPVASAARSMRVQRRIQHHRISAPRYRLYLHGCIDGFSRFNVYCTVSAYTNSETVYQIFRHHAAS